MKKIAYVVLGYAIIVFMGGIMGGFIAHSIPSLVAGISFGALISLNAYKIFKMNVKGVTLALIQSIILGSFFIYRFKISGAFFPAGMMVILSFCVAGFLLLTHPNEVPSKDK